MRSAILVLEDGSVFRGKAIGHQGLAVGEVVFNTSMTGYQEILTDPSYARQIVTLTYPHIGNTGTNAIDFESKQVYACGLVIRDISIRAQNWRSETDLDSFLKQNNTTAIYDLDTRRLTNLLREKGALRGAIMSAEKIDDTLVSSAQKAALESPSLHGFDLAKTVTTAQSYEWLQGSVDILHEGTEKVDNEEINSIYHVVAYDFGVKQNILRLLVDHDCRVTVVPATTSAEDVVALNPDGIFLSNGPGDPEPCDYAIKAIRVFLNKKIPIFGICLGHQLLALASGASTEKMKCGHHGANHPVIDLETGKVIITSQNHGFTVAEDSLPSNLRISHRSLFDNTIQGLIRTDVPAFGFQGHPEASPGPQDCQHKLFSQFTNLMQSNNR